MKRLNPPATAPDLILTGDWHLRETTPVCRNDNFWAAQWDKVQQIKVLQQKYGCPVWHSGDLFDHWKPSPLLLSETMQNIPDQFWTVYGNHDLPQHSLELAEKCGIRTLEIAGYLRTMTGVHWGEEPDPDPQGVINLLVWHVMTYTGNSPWPGCTDLRADEILDKYPGYELILTGHNHKSFTAQAGARILVNPGSLTRQTADQIDHQPCVYLWYSKGHKAIPYYLRCNPDAVSRAHIEQVQARNTRIDAFVERLTKEWQAGFSFEENLRHFAQINQIRKSVMDIIWRTLE